MAAGSSPAGGAGQGAAKGADPQRAAIEDVLRRTGGNVSRAAQALGLNRTTLRRLLERYQIDPRSIAGIIPRESAAARKRDC
jgi:DNA-binding NtrC family response regulator